MLPGPPRELEPMIADFASLAERKTLVSYVAPSPILALMRVPPSSAAARCSAARRRCLPRRCSAPRCRSRWKRPTHSAARCCESAALPPLPKRRTLLPFPKASAMTRTTCSMRADSR